MEKLTIVGKPIVNTKDKGGRQLTGKYGDYNRVSFKTAEIPGQWISHLCKPGSRMTTLNDGDVIEGKINVTEKDGNTYYNFELPKETVTRAEFEALVKRVTELENKEIPVDDIPVIEDDEYPGDVA